MLCLIVSSGCSVPVMEDGRTSSTLDQAEPAWTALYSSHRGVASPSVNDAEGAEAVWAGWDGGAVWGGGWEGGGIGDRLAEYLEDDRGVIR